MNALLLTVLALSGADGTDYPEAVGGVDATCAAAGGHGNAWNRWSGCWGPMPQSGYNPSDGCYAGTRFMHRYPAFHGTYYRNAYNYRTYFDYPWHAGLQEPTSHFSYRVPGAAGVEEFVPPVPTAEPVGQPAVGPSRSVRR
ncbi:MAG: hypothetical protein WD872_08160 [Pirellulaceae bacterium]